MKGICVYKNILKSEKEGFDNSSVHKEKNFNISRHSLPKDTVFYIYPQADSASLKTYYIEKGDICILETGETLTQGDIIVCNELELVIVLHFLTDAVILAQTINEDPEFSYETRMKKMDMLMQSIQDKDAYTRDHCIRVLQMAKLMGLALGYKSTRLNNLNKAARFHDLGKIYIDDEILNKAGKLDEAEYKNMKKHVDLGKILITEKFGQEIYTIIEQHHERLNGSGYPYGLKEGEICEEARIIAICDSLDAMTHDRVYKKAISKKDALAELLDMADSSYDRELVELLIRLIDNPEVK